MDESGKDKVLIDGFPRNEENRAAFEKQARRRGMAESLGGGVVQCSAGQGGAGTLRACAPPWRAYC